MKNKVIFFILFVLINVSIVSIAHATPPRYYVDQPYSDIDAVNQGNMANAGLHFRMRLGKYYHVEFKDGGVFQGCCRLNC
jgi:hypothetical protein